MKVSYNENMEGNAENVDFSVKMEEMPLADMIPLIPDMIFKEIDREEIEKIYLFGSYAYGEPDEDSDVDVCVIIGNNLSRPDMQYRIKKILRENKIVPSDLFVYNSDVFYDATKLRNIEKVIVEHGVLLYG
jgi:predicted nucleotidyltransferase